ncbi:MAG: glycosyltransferase family 2 protein, partial [Thermoguttaceae bacterium]|nr:glycosyltransferase family 2 protein [Thermoguttaceae bacterium]
MLLSIIVPVYNVKDYVIKCLESIYRQTLQDYEVIVVDDGSTDGSGELVDEYCRDKEQFHVFHKPNGGLMSAWMKGVA